MFSEFTSLVSLFDYFDSEDKCTKYLEKMRYPEGVSCQHCGHKHVYNTKRKRTDGTIAFGYKCASQLCYKKSTVTTGTYMEAAKIDLRLWFGAFYLCSSNKKSISSVQLGKFLNVSQKTAWFMLMRIRGTFRIEKPELLTGTVEIDETYIGGKTSGGNQGRSTKSKAPVLGMVERGGKVRVQVVTDAKAKTIMPVIEANVKAGTMVVTDEWGSYNGLHRSFFHERVKHSAGEYVRDSWHTNTIEGFWSQLKRQIIGTHHWVSKKHLAFYTDECAYKWNSRHLNDPDRFSGVLCHLEGRLKYEVLTAPVIPLANV